MNDPRQYIICFRKTRSYEPPVASRPVPCVECGIDLWLSMLHPEAKYAPVCIPCVKKVAARDGIPLVPVASKEAVREFKGDPDVLAFSSEKLKQIIDSDGDERAF